MSKKRLFITFRYDRISSIGIGAMIVFVAMVLVSGIAASVLIQTSSQLESQALASSGETKTEVSSDIDVIKITGQYGTRNIGGTYYSRFHNMTIMVTPRSASKIDLSEAIVQISNESELLILSWDTTYNATPSSNGVFSTPNAFDLNASSFGIIVVEDHDGSCTSTAPAINNGDKVLITVNLSACFCGLAPRDDISGLVVTEYGSPGVFRFRTPGATSRTVVNLL